MATYGSRVLTFGYQGFIPVVGFSNGCNLWTAVSLIMLEFRGISAIA